jgi:hypothetical protein
MLSTPASLFNAVSRYGRKRSNKILDVCASKTGDALTTDLLYILLIILFRREWSLVLPVENMLSTLLQRQPPPHPRHL